MLEQMKLKKRLNFGYFVVIIIMVVSGLFSFLGLGILYGNLSYYTNRPEQADTAVKMCRININIAARNIREMALNSDSSTYTQYKNNIQEKLDDLSVQLEKLKNTKMIDDELFEEYEATLNNWGVLGYAIIGEIEAGNKESATQKILQECAPALDEVVKLSAKIDEHTDQQKKAAIKRSQHMVEGSIALIILLIIGAVIVSTKIGKRIVTSVLQPLREIEKVANELAAGNLHSNLEYRSTDEIGGLAHSLRKSIRILGSYIDDIARAMKEFSSGNFDVKPEVDWKGDFKGILDSFMLFEGSMTDTVKGIQRVADQVTNGAQQVAASSMDLAEGATSQAGITKELTVTIESTSNQVSENAKNARQISKKVENVEVEIINSNEKMQEMVVSMSEINDSSQEISKIIAAINDIASQTNLLALNASIEAARAGEAGKGFAVVADQVSVLAAQSAKAAKESSSLIESSVKAVEKGRVIADDTAKQLENVVSGAKVITENVNRMADVLEEQALSIADINKGVDHINDIVQTNSATSQECAAASEQMSGLAETLEGLIKELKVQES